MPTTKRPRACDNCHGIKIKCELGSIGGSGPCERCVRLGKECVVTPPKRQKDRVAELEAQVKTLTDLLEAQKLKHAAGSPGADSSTTSTLEDPSRQKKRKLSDRDQEGEPLLDGLIALDAIVSPDVQKSLLRKYLDDMYPKFPLLPVTGDVDYDTMRESRPLLLQSIVYAASPGDLSLEQQEDVGKLIMNLFAREAFTDGKKSMELVQAMQMTEIMSNMAEQIGCGRPWGSPEIDHEMSAADARRIWIVCQLLNAVMAIHARRPSPSPCIDDAEDGIYLLEYAYAQPSDRILCHYARAEGICEKIVERSNCYASTVQDVSDPSTQQNMQSLQDLITDWKSQIPADLCSMPHEFLEQAAIMYVHEPVLHTPTNKQSFSAPYIAEKLSVTDFPKPNVKQEHMSSIAALKTASHALIDLYSNLDAQTAIAMPAVLFAARVLYALFILHKIYIASTAIGNTFGLFIDPQALQLEEYIEKVSIVAREVYRVDDRCGQSRILHAAWRMKEWLSTYNNRLMERRKSQPLMAEIKIPHPVMDGQPVIDDSFDWSALELGELFPGLPETEWYTGTIDGINFNAPLG